MGEGTGGGVDTDVGGAGLDTGGGRDTSPSTPASLGFGGARGDIVARETTPAPVVETPRVAFNNQPMSGDFFVNRVSRGLQNLFSGGTQTDDRGPSGADVGAVSVDDNQFNQGLASLSGVPDFVRIGGGTSPSDDRDTDTTMAALRRAVPTLRASNAPDFVTMGGGTSTPPPQDFQNIIDRPQQGFQNIIDRPQQGFQNIIGPLRTTGGDPLLFQDSRIMGMSPGAMGGRAPSYGMSPGAMGGLAPDLTSRPSGALAEVALPATRPSDAVMLAAAAKNPTSERDFSFREFLGNIFKNLGSKAKSVGAFISGLSAEKLQEYAEQFLAGGANQKASTVGMDPFAQQGMGPGPFVGGGVPSPSDGGGMAMPAKDPCPPGFRFDPTLQQCVPIIAPNTPTDTTTTPTTPTTPAPGTSPPAAGGIANAYPFVLTPPIGTPVGNLPPVRLTT